MNSEKSWPDKLLFAAPFVLWACVFYILFDGRHIFYADAGRNFVYSNYFTSHLMRGVFPMWDPFNFWGRPDDFAVRVIGEFNPFLLICAFITKLGISFTNAYAFYSSAYFFTGMYGFYLLSKRIYQNETAAFLALTILLFSSFSTNIFNDILVILMFVPAVWFFTFFISFIGKQERVYFLGMTFCAMMIAVTYIPFYFITVFLFVVIGFGLIHFRKLIDIFGIFYRFALKENFFVSGCTLCLLLALIPGLLWYQASLQGDFVMSWRAGEPASNAAAMSYEGIARSGIAGPITLSGLISDLDYIRAGSFFVPIFAFIILLLGVIVPITGRLILFLFVGTVLLLISLADVTPVHRFLFEHAVIFKYFRNLHYLLWLALPFYTLFAVGQFKYLLEFFKVPEGRLAKFLFVSAVHAGFLFFLLNMERIITSSFLVVILSYAYFSALIFSRHRGEGRLLMTCLLLIVVLQPLEVYYHFAKNTKNHIHQYAKKPYSKNQFEPRFSYQRPLEDDRDMIFDIQGFGNVKDASGFMQGPFMKSKWSHDLYENMDHEILKEYVRHKFILYDKEVSDAFLKGGQIISKDLDDFRVVNFDLNKIELKTNFSEEKFMVYNDSYHKDWQASINGDRAQIVRANIAFKGLLLPKGENVVEFQFRPAHRYYLNFLLLMLFNGFFIYLLIKVIRIKAYL